jgi:hypothetical protein
MLSWSAVFSIVTVIPNGIIGVGDFFAGDGVLFREGDFTFFLFSTGVRRNKCRNIHYASSFKSKSGIRDPWIPACTRSDIKNTNMRFDNPISLQMDCIVMK